MGECVDLKRLEFALTYDCSSNCKHCFVEETTKREYSGLINRDLAVSLVKDLASEYNLESVMTFGGEPLLYPEVTGAIHRTAKAAGVDQRQIITNGFWSKREDKIMEIAEEVGASGVNNILISVDYFHQNYVPLEIVEKTAAALLKQEIELIRWNPCWVGGKEADNKYNQKTREILKHLNYLGIPSSPGNNLSPDGLALKNLAEFMPAKSKYPVGRCGDKPYTSDRDKIESICIEPNGEVYICKNLQLGNASSRSIREILGDYNPYEVEELKLILEKGMEGLLEYAEQKDIAVSETGYYNICAMCSDILADFAYSRSGK